ncbi:UDP-glucose 4-epimerase [Enterococcus saigonensis]|uniref:UDP-glucose 4-epimerase n=1 Tax=Enterococcus saigonensis TaxID=1805431 RepID=A0A679I9K4_9ENTE|nr:NAD-dependent epimerase/dehydratase family protein [Enterococcus saigonensis]BCA85003.1 UDP-glucose 4-epimerase [Enterococcus saigonensis]
MKRILITGKNSYVGNSFIEYLKYFSHDFFVNSLNMKDDNWKNFEFSNYDIVIHLAAIVHSKEKDESLYYRVNRDLAYETAKMAKISGVKQFIYFSTMAVYGNSVGHISSKTPLVPQNPYGKSKLEGEKLISSLNDDDFKVVILRPPMIYGKNSIGNYTRLAKFAKKIPIFPKINNKRSMLFIGNLNIFLKAIIDNETSGIFYPQNKEYVNTSQMVQLIAQENGKKIVILPGFSKVINIMMRFNTTFEKVFGDLFYEEDLLKSNYLYNSHFVTLEDSIKKTEK